MTARSENLVIVWEDLKASIDNIFTKKSMSYAQYMGLYSHVYNHCTFVEPNVRVNTSRTAAVGADKLVGLELYNKLRSYLKQHVMALKSKGDVLVGEELLSFFEKNWRDFRFAARVLNGTCNYLNRNWVKREFEEGRKNVVIVFALALMIWRDCLFKQLSRPLMAAILREIERERNGEVIETTRLQATIDCLVELRITSEQHPPHHVFTMSSSVNPSIQTHLLAPRAPPIPPDGGVLIGSQYPVPLVQDIHRSPLDPSTATSATLISESRSDLTIYQEHFEQPFLKETQRFYMIESAEFLKSNSVTEYLQRVEVRLKEECNRVRTYLHISSLQELMRTCEKSLIGDHIERLAQDFPALLNDDRIEDLARMYRQMGRFDSAVSSLVSMMETHVEERGSAALRQVCQTAITNPKLFVDTIIEVQRKNSNLVLLAFSMDPAFQRALDKGCERFINRNAVTDLAGSSRKSPELLAKYVDMLLKKGSKEAQPDDLEETLNRVMEVFRYVEDKDVFQRFYSNMLARRLVNNMSISEDSEALMISRLKGTCGFEYTTKLQRMFQDVSSSRDLNTKFIEHLNEPQGSAGALKGVDFSIMVLSSNAWPFSAQTAFSIPKELDNCSNVFTAFYQKHHTGRKLAWCYNLSRGDVVTHYTKTRHTFQVSTFQIAILMLYNNALSYTVQAIQSQTGIEMSTLTQVLNILLKARILKLADPGNPNTDKKAARSSIPSVTNTDEVAGPTPTVPITAEFILTPEIQLALYTDYNNKRVRVNLNLPVKSEAKQETESTLVNVESDRKLIVQACIVRIMKTRKVMPHHQLINEVISQLALRFRPTISLIKQSVTSLIEREFIKRDENDRDKYEYMA